MAAWMLRNGDDPDRVAAVTDVPFALVELIAEYSPSRAACPQRPGIATDPASVGKGLENAAGFDAQQTRRRVRILRGAAICALVNAALGVAAVLVHADTIGAVCRTLLLLSYAVVLVLQLLLPPRTPPRHRRR